MHLRSVKEILADIDGGIREIQEEIPGPFSPLVGILHTIKADLAELGVVIHWSNHPPEQKTADKFSELDDSIDPLAYWTSVQKLVSDNGQS